MCLIPLPEASLAGCQAEVPAGLSNAPEYQSNAKEDDENLLDSHGSKAAHADKVILASAFCLSASAWESDTFHFVSTSVFLLLFLLSLDFLASSVFFFEA